MQKWVCKGDFGRTHTHILSSPDQTAPMYIWIFHLSLSLCLCVRVEYAFFLVTANIWLLSHTWCGDKGLLLVDNDGGLLFTWSYVFVYLVLLYHDVSVAGIWRHSSLINRPSMWRFNKGLLNVKQLFLSFFPFLSLTLSLCLAVHLSLAHQH